MSHLTLVIGNKNYSSWSLRPWVFLRHHHIDFLEKSVPLFVDSTAAQLEEYDSDYKVPVLKDSDLIIWDSLSILEYLSDVYLEGRGWPEEPEVRSVARSISAEMHSSFMNVRSEMPMNCRRKINNVNLSEAAKREIKRISDLWQKCRTGYGEGGEWLFGDFSIADAMYAPVALRFNGYGIPLSGVVGDYVQSILSHPAIVDWVEAGKLETEIIEENEIDA